MNDFCYEEQIIYSQKTWLPLIKSYHFMSFDLFYNIFFWLIFIKTFFVLIYLLPYIYFVILKLIFLKFWNKENVPHKEPVQTNPGLQTHIVPLHSALLSTHVSTWLVQISVTRVPSEMMIKLKPSVNYRIMFDCFWVILRITTQF